MIRFLCHTKQLDLTLKQNNFETVRIVPIVLATLALGACSANPFSTTEKDSILRDKSLDYAQSQVLTRLIVPADLDSTQIQQDLLTVPALDDVQSASGITQAPRPDFVFAQTGNSSARLTGDGLQNRISVAGNLAKVKAQVEQFWANQKITLVTPALDSQVETQWFSLADDAPADDFISRWIRSLTNSDDDIAYGRVKVELTTTTDERVDLSLFFLQHSQLQIEQLQTIDWEVSGHALANQSEITYELLRYLSRSAQTAQKTQQQATGATLALLGKDQFDQPVIQLDMNFAQALPIVLAVMTDFDLGSHSLVAKKIYFTHVSHQRSSQELSSNEGGIWGWFKGLHTGNSETRKQGINLNLALAGGAEQQEIADAPVYSSDPNQLAETSDLADKKGYKIWLADKVIYVFEDADQGDVNEQGEYTYAGQYQLSFEETLKSTYIQVLNNQGEAAPIVYAKEVLWKIQQRLDP